ncbi:DNA packaging protein [Aneurinibacillus thermoaerophilus]|uniref:DNA packaging protein n=1 Tax=Aneurinibacillus thermoaerophilus TaxID=143495 RepID=UPI002E238E93|nr:DNA packaging protein [Aneurinibacillus thermoaerophilus]MED0765526.1 DNA packaging protein [Aneurinibacillus thermoaerophilus]
MIPTTLELALEHRKRISAKYRKKPKAIKQVKAILEDFERFCAKCLRIKTKDGALRPLILNEAQKKLARTVFSQIAQDKPVRIIILKARQMGFSTTTEAIIYYLSSLQEAKNAFIVAQDSSASENLYDMFRLYYENAPAIFKPMRKRNNSRRLTFENPSTKETERRKNPGLKSKITVQSAENRVLARSETIHYLHISELAFWPAKKKKKHLDALFAALSKEPGTVGIIESTANGMEEYKALWDAAVNGENDFTPLFFPWFEMPDYRKPVPPDFVPTKEELELKQRFKLDDEQLMWRRYTIRNDFNGDERQFRQEYPSVPEEAFLLSGDGIFDNEYIQKLLDAIQTRGMPHEIDVVKKTVKPTQKGKLVVYRPPEVGKRYVIGADTAKGKSTGDWDVAYVLEARTGEMCAALRGKWDTDLYGKMLDVLGRWYNIALLAVENNNTGESVLNTLYNTCQYPLLFMWKKGDLGWNTNNATRPVMISDFKEAIRDQLFPIYCHLLYKECLTFIDKNGKPQADNGCTDDCIMAYAIALQVRLVADNYYESGFFSFDRPI